MSNRLPVIADEIRRAHADARAAARYSAERALEAGRLLIEAKAAVGHGEWLPWLRANVELSERTARGYMTLARSGMKSATVADLGLRASLARVARRKGPALNLHAGVMLRLLAGRQIQIPDPLLREAQPEHTLWLWSVDGEFAWKAQISVDPNAHPDPWLFSIWKRPVRLNALRSYLIAEGFPLAEARVAERTEAEPDELADWARHADETRAWVEAFTALGAPGLQ